ncbi:MAG: tRNA glutamyl-Q(34) synthetase GluQRS [Planctomycetes bacterium]|nr:tRNA glutamyl-Q(34) synthetase GluQRS [Planctomycetota bacterium]
MPIGRLAPSPTGVLHLGNARSFLLAWLSVRTRGGTVLLRIEDIDGPRVRPECTAATLDDLAWLGLTTDGDPLLQSTRLAHYAHAVSELLDAGLAYPCVCSRREIEEAGSAPHESWQDAAPYPGTCRDRYGSIAEARRQSGRDPAVRFRVTTDAVPFHDVYRGAEPGLVRGDFVIQKRDGAPAYQLAVVVDDAASGITEVLRGDDLLASTPRQLLLYRALGLQEPQFVHVPLLVGADGRRLAKRHGDTSLRTFRGRGVTAPQLIGYLAQLSGLRPTAAACSAADLLVGFSLARVPREPAVPRAPWLPGD